MLVIIKSASGSQEAMRGLKVAGDISARLVLMQDAVYMARKGGLEGFFTGDAFVVEEDLKLRGNIKIDESVRSIGYDELVGLMAEDDKIIGMF